jgi:hypothetical protein
MAALRFFPSTESEPDDLSINHMIFSKPAFAFIEEKLQRNEYSRLQDCIDDVETTIDKYEKSSSSVLYISLARHVRERFHKLCRDKRLFTIQSWCFEVQKLREAAISMMETAPPKVKSRSAPLLAKLIRSKPSQILSDRELQNFVRASEQLTEDDDQRALIQILRDEGVDVRELNKLNVTIDLTTLKSSTFRRLEAYVRRTFDVKGIPYPD